MPIRDGLPDVLGGVKVYKTVKIPGINTPHPAIESEDYVLRREVREFFQMMSKLGDAEITDLEIRDGLPLCFEVAEVLTA